MSCCIDPFHSVTDRPANDAVDSFCYGTKATLAARHVIHGLAPDAFRLGYVGLNEQEIDRAVEPIKAAYLRN